MNNSKSDTINIIGAPRPPQPSIAETTRERIHSRIIELIKSTKDDPKKMRNAAEALGVLPLSAIQDDRWYGVRPDGDLISFDLSAPHHEVEEEDLWRRCAILTQASEYYPELEALIPPPPLSCRTCSRCGGAGEILLGGEIVTCICEGLGWLPSIEDEMEEKHKEKDNASR